MREGTFTIDPEHFEARRGCGLEAEYCEMLTIHFVIVGSRVSRQLF